MTDSYLSITPHDPVIARDGRPFGAGLRMKSLEWPYPSVLAGSVRTALGKMNDDNPDAGIFDDPSIVNTLKAISVHGPLPLFGGKLYFPAPRDLMVKKTGNKPPETFSIRPVGWDNLNGRCDLPMGLEPAMLSEKAKDEFKPEDAVAFWPIEKIVKWLVNSDGKDFNAPLSPKPGEAGSSDKKPDVQNLNTGLTPENSTKPRCYGLSLPLKESRFHTQIDLERGNASDSRLYETVGLDFALRNQKEGLQISAKIGSGNKFKNTTFAGFKTMGGERRLAYWKSNETAPDGWNCPDVVKVALCESSQVRMVLATPAIFSQGWMPGWINPETLTGHPPGAKEGLQLKLVSACVERWKPLSGFSLEKDKEGPKPLRRLVPAGSVFFFRIESGKASDLEECWLMPMSDDSQDRLDGFGLALWGIWDYEDNGKANEMVKEG